uniref:uncharacterized protein LOC122582620 n=1 Tax=Erigeron canadensis TaxID=72917 RepID=UPI001CB91B3A|nr:uncharacterized protein LOC122582620 [Erigeron canadensis]
MSPLIEFAHLRIPLQEIKSATDNFADEHIIGRGGFGKVYKGQLLQRGQLTDVAIKRLDRDGLSGQGDKEFWTDIAMRSSLNHVNLDSIVGFCDEVGERIIVNYCEVNGSLDKHLSSPNLTWLQRLHVCIGVARALSYIHYDTGRSYDVIHRNIKSYNVVLDGNWEAKLSGFGLSVKVLATQRHRPVSGSAVGTIGYVDPVYVKTGSLTRNSDVYSFGVVLFEVLSGRQALVKDAAGKYQFLAPIATRHYEKGKLDAIVDPCLRNQMHPQSFKFFTDTAYHCLKKDRAERPDMEKVAKRLEKAWELQRKHENPAHLRPPVTRISPNYHKEKNLDHMKIQLADIKLATKSFSEAYCIGYGGYGRVYKAELEHFDSDCQTEIEGKSKSEFLRRRSTVAIKRIFYRADGQGEQSFYSEIALLIRCKHPNVVSLLGFCDDGDERILVYEHASHGSLDDYLGNTDNMTTFNWVQRIQLCLDIANGLKYLHSTIVEKQMIVHRDIKSANILLGKSWEAKIADFGLSRIQHANNQASTLNTYHVAGTEVYLDPEYMKTGKLKKESDIYSFGVVLFEILCGRLATDECYNVGNDKGLPSTVRRLENKGLLKEIVDRRVMEETDINSFHLNRGPNQDSLDAFMKIAYQCLADTGSKRPTMGVIIAELEKSLYFQKNNKDKLKISLAVIKLATQNFSNHNLIGNGGFGGVFKGEVTHANQHHVIAAKRLDRRFGQGEPEFIKELEILMEYKNDNVIGLVGYCDECDEKIIVYEYATYKSLELHLNSTDLTWMKRLKICIDVASGLEFLHGGVVRNDAVIHRDIKSANILLTADWKAKITDFGLSLICPINQEIDYVIDYAVGTMGYCDPLYVNTGILTKESDMYSFGVVLFEILCGRRSYINYEHVPLNILVRKHMYEGKIGDIVFEAIKEQIVPESLTTYSRVAFKCLHEDREKRPTAGEVVLQLKQALEFQEDHEIWEPKLPGDYKEIIQMSKTPDLYSVMCKKDLYNILCKGILLQDGKVWFSLGTNGVRHEMISAKFSYKSPKSHRWLTILESRFPKVAEITDISKLKTRVKIRTQFLSPGVNYRVHLVFKFCCPRKASSTPMFVNLTYKMWNETLHSYFATWRDEDWMMIELFQFLNNKNVYDFKIQLESFSRYYCKSRPIYVEGFEFRAMDNVKREEINRLKEVQQASKSKLNSDELTLLRKAELIKHPMISAKGALFDSSNVKLFDLNSSGESRFPEEIELLSQQVLHIKCKITQTQLLPNTEYVCYLVFKLSEKCRGLHCPVIIRDLLRWRSKEVGILYFRSPSPWNLRDDHHVPEKREDGWMEVLVWKSNSGFEPRNDYIPINLKLIVYEGTLSGLIVRGLEFRSM